VRPDQLAKLVEGALDPSQIQAHLGPVLLQVLAQYLMKQIALVFKIFVDKRFGHTGAPCYFGGGDGAEFFFHQQRFQSPDNFYPPRGQGSLTYVIRCFC
jgi:hypothetical protein